jgi:hypothetical protein
VRSPWALSGDVPRRNPRGANPTTIFLRDTPDVEKLVTTSRLLAPKSN